MKDPSAALIEEMLQSWTVCSWENHIQKPCMYEVFKTANYILISPENNSRDQEMMQHAILHLLTYGAICF